MVSFIFFTPVLFLIIVLMFYFFWERKNISPEKKKVGKMKINLKYIALLAIVFPYLVTSLILCLGGKEPIAHFKFKGLKFSLPLKKNVSRIITIGGSPGNDIQIPGLPKDAFYIKNSEDGLLLYKGNGYTGFEIVEHADKICGLVALKDGAKITIKDKKGKITDFELSQGGICGSKVDIIHGNKRIPIQKRRSQIPFLDITFPMFSLPSAYNKIFPLGQLVASEGESWQKGSGFKSSILFGDFEAKNKKGEIFEPYLLALDPGVSVNGGEVDSFPLKIEDGSSLAFLTINGGAKPRLIFVQKIKEVKIGNDTVEFVMQRPDTIGTRLEDGDGGNRYAIGKIENLHEKNIRFKNLSDIFGKYFAIFELGEDEINVSGPFMNKKMRYYQDIEIGNEEKFVVEIVRIDVPWRLIRLLIFTALVVIIFSFRLLPRVRYIILFGVVAILTSYRVLFAYSAAVLPPFSNETVPLSLFLLVFAPSLMVAIDALIKAVECQEPVFLEQRTSYIINGIAALLFSGVVGLPQLRHLSPALMLGAAIPLLMLLTALVAVFFIPMSKKFGSKFEKIHLNFKKIMLNNATRTLNTIFITFVGIRLVLLMAGSKESINIGARFSISIITVPILVLFIALSTSQYIQNILVPGQKQKPVLYRYIGYTFGFSTTFFLFAFITSDLGQIIFALPISIFWAVIMIWSFNKLTITSIDRKHFLILVLPLITIVLFLKFPMFFFQAVDVVAEKDLVVKRITDTEIVSNSQNMLRLMQYVAPNHLDKISSRDSESVAQHYFVMNAYTRRGFTGEGYMNVKIHPSLYRTCLNDNVSAVYIFSQFGTLGAIAIILTYSMLVLVGYKSRWVIDEDVQLKCLGFSLGILSMLTIIMISLYMIGANCNLLLFTGRNLYFMGLNSLSDIFESTILLGFIVAGIAIDESYFSKNKLR